MSGPAPSGLFARGRVRRSTPAGQTFIGAMLVLMGLGQGAVFYVQIAREHRVATTYIEAECTVVSTRPPRGKEGSALYADVTLEVGGVAIPSKGLPASEDRAAALVPGARVPCFYDADRPGPSARFDRSESPHLFWAALMLLPILLVGLGVRSMVRSVKQARHLAG